MIWPHRYYPCSLLIPVQLEWLHAFPCTNQLHSSSNPLHCFCLKFSSSSYTMMFLLSPSSGICIILSVKSILTFFILAQYPLLSNMLHILFILFSYLSPVIRKEIHARKEFHLFYLFYLLLYAPAPKKESQAYRSFSLNVSRTDE